MCGNLPGTFVSSKRKTKLQSIRLFCRPHPQETQRKESLWSIAEHAHGQQERPQQSRIGDLENIENPTMVMTANVEMLAKEEATVYVRELDLFVTVMLVENTPAVLSLEKLCEEFGYSYHWISGQKPHLIKNGKKFLCDTSYHVPFVVPGLSTSSSTSSTSPTTSSQETCTDTEIPATRSSEHTSEESLAQGGPVA